jgi:hypothetical protein
MLNDAIEKARKNDELKVGFSLKMPKSLKDRLDSTAKKNNVPVGSLVISMLETVFDNYDKSEESNKEIDIITLLDRLNEAKLQLSSYEELFEKVGDEITDVNGATHYPLKMIESSKLEIKVLETELIKRSKK